MFPNIMSRRHCFSHLSVNIWIVYIAARFAPPVERKQNSSISLVHLGRIDRGLERIRSAGSRNQDPRRLIRPGMRDRRSIHDLRGSTLLRRLTRREGDVLRRRRQVMVEWGVLGVLPDDCDDLPAVGGGGCGGGRISRNNVREHALMDERVPLQVDILKASSRIFDLKKEQRRIES